MSIIRRPSLADSSSSSEVNFDDLDDQQVFTYLEDADDDHSSTTSRSPKSNVEFRLDLSSRFRPPPARSPPATTRKSAVSPFNRAAQSKSPGQRRSQSSVMTRSPIKGRGGRRASSSDAVSPSTSSTTAGIDPVDTAALGSPRKDQGKVFAEPSSAPRETQRTKFEAASAVELSEVMARAADLRERLAASEQTNEALVAQVRALKDEQQDKLVQLHEHMSEEKRMLLRRHEEEVAHQQSLFLKEKEVWQKEMGMMEALQVELQQQNDALRLAMDEQKAQRAQTEKLMLALEKAQLQERADLLALRQWKEYHSGIQALQDRDHEELTRKATAWAKKCEALTEEVARLRVHREDRDVFAAETSARQHNLLKQQLAHERLVHGNFAREIKELQTKLKELAVDTKEQLRKEMKKTSSTLARIQQQACEMAIVQNQKEMALVSRQNRIIQLETQLKNEKQVIDHLEATLKKTVKANEKRETALKTKYQEQKEHFDVTLAVRSGLTAELQARKIQLQEKEKELSQCKALKEKLEKKLKHQQQQIQIMQHTHVREMERIALGTKSEQQLRRASSQRDLDARNQQQQNEKDHVSWSPDAAFLMDPLELMEFVELVSVYEEEIRRKHSMMKLGEEESYVRT